MDDKEYRQTLQNQWKSLTQILNLDERKSTPHRREFAKQALLVFFNYSTHLINNQYHLQKKVPFLNGQYLILLLMIK